MNKPNRAERTIAFLEDRYPAWTEATRFEAVGGRCGWRTALSLARKAIRQREGRTDDPIPNRLTYQTDANGEPWILSEYRLKKRAELEVASANAPTYRPHDVNVPREGRLL